MKWYLLAVALLHALFMVLEMFPWESPFLLTHGSRKLPTGEGFTPAQHDLVATIVRNVGVYNGVFAAGLAWAALMGESADNVARVLLAGVAVAGIFGTATLKSAATAVQAAAGIAGLLFMRG